MTASTAVGRLVAVVFVTVVSVGVLAGPVLAAPVAPVGVPPAAEQPDVPPSADDPDGQPPGDAGQPAPPTDDRGVIERTIDRFDPTVILVERMGDAALWLFSRTMGVLSDSAEVDAEADWLAQVQTQLTGLAVPVMVVAAGAAIVRAAAAGRGEPMAMVVARVFGVGLLLALVLPFWSVLLDAVDVVTADMITAAGPGAEAMIETLAAVTAAGGSDVLPVVLAGLLSLVVTVLSLWLWLLMAVRGLVIYVLLAAIALPAAMSVFGSAAPIKRWVTWLAAMTFLPPAVAVWFIVGAAPFASVDGAASDAGVVAMLGGAGLFTMAGLTPWFLVRLFDFGAVAPAASMLESVTPSSAQAVASHPVSSSRAVWRSRERSLQARKSSTALVSHRSSRSAAAGAAGPVGAAASVAGAAGRAAGRAVGGVAGAGRPAGEVMAGVREGPRRVGGFEAAADGVQAQRVGPRVRLPFHQPPEQVAAGAPSAGPAVGDAGDVDRLAVGLPFGHPSSAGVSRSDGEPVATANPPQRSVASGSVDGRIVEVATRPVSRLDGRVVDLSTPTTDQLARSQQAPSRAAAVSPPREASHAGRQVEPPTPDERDRVSRNTPAARQQRPAPDETRRVSQQRTRQVPPRRPRPITDGTTKDES